MKKMIFAAAAAVALTGCGDSVASVDSLQNGLANSVDEQALRQAVDRAVDEKALEQAVVGTAKGAVDQAVDEAIREVVPVAPVDLGAFGAAIDEKALVDGVARAVDADAVVGVAKPAAEDAGPAR